MTLEEQLQDAYQRAAERAPVSTGAYDRFLRRRARRGRVVAATAGLALVAVLGAAVLVARQLPQERGPVAPAGEVVRVPEQGFELPVPAGWRVQRQLTGPGSQVVGWSWCPALRSCAARRSRSSPTTTSRPTTSSTCR